MSLGSYVTGSSALPYSASVAVPVSGTVMYANDIIEPVRTLADRTAVLSASLFNLSSSIRNYALGGFFFSSSAGQGGNILASADVEFSIWTGKLSITNNLTAIGGGITASLPGIYRADYYLTMRPGSANVDATLISKFAINGTVQSESISIQTFNSGGLSEPSDFIFNTAVLSSYFQLAANDIVSVRLRASGSSTEAIRFHHGQFTLNKVTY